MSVADFYVCTSHLIPQKNEVCLSLEFLIHKAEKKVAVEFRPVRKVASPPFHPHFLSSVPRLCCCWEISYNSRKTVPLNVKTASHPLGTQSGSVWLTQRNPVYTSVSCCIPQDLLQWLSLDCGQWKWEHPGQTGSSPLKVEFQPRQSGYHSLLSG